MGKFIDLSGKKFGKLTVLNRDFTGKDSKRTYWLCECECGNKKVIGGDALKANLTKSCGCRQKEIGRENGLNNLKEPKPYSTLFHRTKRSALKRNLSFNISLEEFKTLISQNCYLCGTPPKTIWKKQAEYNLLAEDLIYNGIDRINNKVGYEIDNCKPCCWRCNIMKRDQSLEGFINHLSMILERYS